MLNNKDNSIDRELNRRERIRGSLLGFFVGDALGVPVEFTEREELKKNKVTKMLEYGTYNQPIGSWSDDSSMVIATIDSINNNNGINYMDIMDNFLKWYKEGEYTPQGDVFDVGNATSMALSNYNNDKTTYICGSKSLYSNGNGSLMRILPISLYLHYANEPMLEIIRNISSMTHAHIYSIMGCVIYSVFVNEYLKVKDIKKAYANMQTIIKKMFDDNSCNILEDIDDLKQVYSRLIYNDISKLDENDIKSTGYVIDSLEACIWCLMNTDNYKDAVLKAVNLGNDTDTIGALTGGLAGLVYGYDDIPENWINVLKRVDYLIELVNIFEKIIIGKKGNRADADDWKCIPFSKFKKAECNIVLTQKEFEKIFMGHIPMAMEDHWFMYCDNESINYFRSWTGIQIFKGYYRFENNHYVINLLEINNNKNEYTEDDTKKSIETFNHLIKSECVNNKL